MVRNFLIASASLVLSAAALGQAKVDSQTDPKDAPAKSLTVGDRAPAIDIEHWIKGDKVAEFKTGKVYVVEFWATWCGPCRMSMPHITDLQTQYKDYGVTFIGVSDEKLETVTKFLGETDKKSSKKWDDIIGYTLTTDPDMSVKKDYFTAAGQNGIPCAFIVGKDQHIEWIGHPMEIEKPLESVVKDNWDRAAFKATWDKEQAAEREMAKAQGEMTKAMKAKDWKKVSEILDAQIAKDPKALAPRMQKFHLLITEMDQPAEGYILGGQIAKDNWDNAQLLNSLAWTTVDTPTVKTRDFGFALKMAERANEVTNDKDGMIQDTLARCYFEKGDLKKAVEIQKKAVSNIPDSAPAQTADEIKATLKKYEDALAKKAG